MPTVSIIIPVYNVAKYLQKSLDTIKYQTLNDIEAICIDDGSTDSSYNLLEVYAAQDRRFKLYKQVNKGAAAARNYGLSIATGKYIIFLDSDDYFDKTMLEKAVLKAEETSADIVVFKAVSFDDATGRESILNDKIHKYPQFQSNTFSAKDLPEDILNSFLAAPWNKLYHKCFLDKYGFQFQNVKRTNDLLFTSETLVMAERIILLNECLLYYRTGQNKSLQSSNDQTPLEFYKALFALKNSLQNKECYTVVYKSYIKLVLEIVLYNINTIKCIFSKRAMIEFFKNIGFKALGLENKEKLYDISVLGYLQYEIIMFDLPIVKVKLLSGLYAVYKTMQYYQVAGFEGSLRKIWQKLALRSRY